MVYLVMVYLVMVYIVMVYVVVACIVMAQVKKELHGEGCRCEGRLGADVCVAIRSSELMRQRRKAEQQAPIGERT